MSEKRPVYNILHETNHRNYARLPTPLLGLIVLMDMRPPSFTAWLRDSWPSTKIKFARQQPIWVLFHSKHLPIPLPLHWHRLWPQRGPRIFCPIACDITSEVKWLVIPPRPASSSWKNFSSTDPVLKNEKKHKDQNIQSGSFFFFQKKNRFSLTLECVSWLSRSAFYGELYCEKFWRRDWKSQKKPHCWNKVSRKKSRKNYQSIHLYYVWIWWDFQCLSLGGAFRHFSQVSACDHTPLTTQKLWFLKRCWRRHGSCKKIRRYLIVFDSWLSFLITENILCTSPTKLTSHATRCVLDPSWFRLRRFLCVKGSYLHERSRIV